MFDVNMVCYPWDLEDAGIDATLDRLRGETGLDGVVYVAACRAVCHLRRLPDVTPRIFRSTGGLCFQPDESKYVATRCRPLVSTWLKARNPLAKTAEACRRRDMTFRAVVDTCRIGRLAERFPPMTTQTAFGEASRECLCLTNPDVSEFLGSMIGDLWSNYAPERIELRDFDRSLAGYSVDHLDGMDALGPAGCALMSVCFCASCLQRAGRDGVDVEAARRSAQVTLSRAIESGEALNGTLGELVTDDELLKEYLASQMTARRELIARLAECSGCDLVWHVDGSERLDQSLIEPLDHPGGGEPGSPAKSLIIDLSDSRREMNEARRSEIRNLCGALGEMRCEAQIAATPTRLRRDDPTASVKAMQTLVELGIGGVNVYHYGSMSGPDFTSVKQAVRFAKRRAAG